MSRTVNDQPAQPASFTAFATPGCCRGTLTRRLLSERFLIFRMTRWEPSVRRFQSPPRQDAAMADNTNPDPRLDADDRDDSATDNLSRRRFMLRAGQLGALTVLGPRFDLAALPGLST